MATASGVFLFRPRIRARLVRDWRANALAVRMRLASVFGRRF